MYLEYLITYLSVLTYLVTSSPARWYVSLGSM